MNAYRSIACAIGLAAISGVASADSVDISFTRITSNSSQNVESQFAVTATEVSGNSAVVDFIFRNNIGIQSSISEIYFDNGSTSSLFASGSIVEQVGTQFNYGSASPGDLPGGNSMVDTFDVTSGFLADAQGNPNKGLNGADELVRFRFTFLGGMAFSDVVSALESDSLRIGFHVRSIGDDGNSDSFVSYMPENGAMVPLPSPMLLGAAGVGLVAGVRRRR